ncbi:MAG: ComEA family DNA-binding protein [Pirellulales bacterium]
MNRYGISAMACAMFASACVIALCVANHAAAEEPVAKPAEATAPAAPPATTDDAKPVAEKDAPAPSSDKPADKNAATAKPGDNKPQPGKPGDGKSQPDEKAAKDKPRSLIAPAGLLDRAPAFIPFAAPGRGKLDLNTATLEQIQRLPGVGVTWAPRILAGRPYRTFGDLARDGIPYTTIESLSRRVELGP